MTMAHNALIRFLGEVDSVLGVMGAGEENEKSVEDIFEKLGSGIEPGDPIYFQQLCNVKDMLELMSHYSLVDKRSRRLGIVFYNLRWPVEELDGHSKYKPQPDEASA